MSNFNHNIALNGAILEGAAKTFQSYGGGFIMTDSMDINWYVDEDWKWTFEEILKGVENSKTQRLWQGGKEYVVFTTETHYQISGVDNELTIKIPNYLVNDLFLVLTTLMRGNYEY